MISSTGLKSRLRSIFELVVIAQKDNPYSTIWDCCCDHGYLGINILREKLCEEIIFVDQVPRLIELLETKLEEYDSSRYKLLVSDAGDLVFDSLKRHLVIIAGVGGECTVDILTAIKRTNTGTNIDYIFCPSTSQNELREYLIMNKFGLINEQIVCESNRYYELLFATNNGSVQGLTEITESCNLWDSTNSGHQRHIEKLLRHAAKKKLGRN